MGSNNSRPKNITKNVVIFGETGVGKSSIINMLLDSEKVKVSNSAKGCTFEYSMVPYEDYLLYDTVGLNEGTAGTVNYKKSTNMLINFLKSTEDGINLLIFVMRGGRISETIVYNYKLFAEVITQNKVPLILVVTHCEDEPNLNEWWAQNKNIFIIKNKMKINDALCVCSHNGEGLDPELSRGMKSMYYESKDKLKNLIDRNVLGVAWRHDDFNKRVVFIIRYFINFVARTDVFPYLPEMKIWLRHTFRLSEDEATKMANDIYRGDELEDISDC